VKRTLAALAAGAAAFAAVPLLGLPPFYETFLYLVFHWVVLATSWNLLSGYSGYVSFGHGAFFGAGVYTTATLATRFDLPFLWTLPVAAAVAALLGVAVGAVVFRVRHVREELFALLTLAVTFVVATVILNTPIDGGPGVYLSAVPIPALGPTASSTFYLLALALAATTLATAYVVGRARLGTALFAIHDDEDVAEVMGVPTYRTKLAALALSCALAGAAGGVHALFVSYVTVGETFSITVPLFVVLMSILGGTRHWAGPAFGAAAITALTYAFTAGDVAILGKAVVGIVLVLVILLMPDGILGRRRQEGGGPAAVAAPAATAAAAPAVPPPAPRRADAPPLLEVSGVAKAFEGVQALRNVNLMVREGEVLGLLGPNGSGKSTLINVVSGHYRADRGRIVFGGVDLARAPAHRIARAGIARTYQIPRPFARLTVRENVTLAAMFGGQTLARAMAEREAARWIDFARLSDRADALPADLNLHQRKFLELARALAFRPRLVLLDEVLSGLNPAEIDSAVELVRDIRAQGATIVLVEHVMRAVMALADRIVVLNYGEVIASGDPAQVMREPAVMTAYLGAPAGA
jgi:branched-chain amino acid transport system permease protein